MFIVPFKLGSKRNQKVRKIPLEMDVKIQVLSKITAQMIIRCYPYPKFRRAKVNNFENFMPKIESLILYVSRKNRLRNLIQILIFFSRYISTINLPFSLFSVMISKTISQMFTLV